MLDFKNRYSGLEMLDEENISTKDLYQNVKELSTINHILGGHQITLSGFKQLIKNRKLTTITIAEIGCGGGDNLRIIFDYCHQHNITCNCIGIDMKQDCINYAKKKWNRNIPAKWVCLPYQQALQYEQVDIIFNSLFCHHFGNDAILEMLQWMKQKTKIGFFINDLHRHWLAFYFIKFATKLFSKSYLVKNDAPISVRRGFVKQDWNQLCLKAKINCSIQWKWAFRHLILFVHQ